MTILTLTDEQFDFLNQYHEALSYGRIAANFFGDYRIIDSIIALNEYQEIMNGMEWDDVLDRYTEHPCYDKSLLLAIYQQFLKLKLP